MLAPGTLVDRYELVSPVGEGGMAQVWVARQKGKHGFEKLFAFKCIHTRFADNPAFRSMFLDEARIAASIEHPNVAQVFDLGEAESMLYLVMEYVDGESLGALMTAASRRANDAVPVPTGVALRIIADACAGLHAAHSLKDAQGNPRGVVHRDVSPQNVLVSVRGDVKVIDFGIAVAKDRIGGDTEAGSLKGKLHYMAPEQALRKELGPYTDVFSIGATLYRMLAGRPPFDAGNDAATLNRLLSGGDPDPLPDSVPPLIGAIVMRALSRDPGDRYQTALAMQTAIEAAMMEEGYVADVATWVTSTLSDNARQRREQLATRTMNIAPSGALTPSSRSRFVPASSEPHPAEVPSANVPSFVAELGPLPERPPPPVMARNPLTRTAAPAPEVVDATAQDLRAPAIAPIGLPTEEPEEKSAPGMLDVRALVARRANEPAPRPVVHASAHGATSGASGNTNGSYAPPASSSSRDVAAGGTSQGEAAPARDPAQPRFVGPTTKAVENAGARGSGWMKLAIVATLLCVVIAVVLLVLPKVVRDRVVASAREAGVDLTVDRVGVGFGGVSLRGVIAKPQRVPGVVVTVDEIYAVGFSAREVRARGIEIKIDGPITEVGPALLRVYEDNRPRLAGSGGEARKVSISGARVTWTGLLGQGSRLDASDLGADLESRAAGAEEIRASMGRFEVKTAQALFGPWAMSFDRSAGTSRLRLLLDPPVPDGPSTLLVWSKASPLHLTVRIPRSPLARLGLRPTELGLPADPGTEVEMKLEGGQSPTTRTEGSGRIDLYGARLRGLNGPVDLKIEGSASGAPGKPLDLEKTVATVGPFTANVTGTITPNDTGFRLDAAWRTLPISCEKLVRAEAKSLGPIAAALQDIAHSTGAARVTGTAQGSGVVRYDTKTPDDATMTFLSKEACGLKIFGL